jgi:hypothetical protein
MVKGDPTVNNTGFLSSFPVVNGKVSMQGFQSNPNGTAVLFGAALIPGTSSVLVTDPSVGAVVIDIDNQTGEGKTLARTPIAGQKAVCWATFSEKTGTVFVTDVGVNRVIEIEPSDGTIALTLDLQSPNGGLIDLQAAGNFVYALWAGNATVPAAISVLDVSGGKGSAKEVQNFVPKNVAPINPQGMAVIR